MSGMLCRAVTVLVLCNTVPDTGAARHHAGLAACRVMFSSSSTAGSTFSAFVRRS